MGQESETLTYHSAYACDAAGCDGKAEVREELHLDGNLRPRRELPPGWTAVGGKVYCDRHEVEVPAPVVRLKEGKG